MTAPTPDRDLLFGLLALQMDFVTTQQLTDAVRAWVLVKQTPLAEILVCCGGLDDGDRVAIERVMQRHVRKHGDSRASLMAVRVADEARAALLALNDADVQANLLAETLPPATPLPVTPLTLLPESNFSPPTLPPQVPEAVAPARAKSPVRYVRLRLHARGGLGEVSVARDQELGREVALKEIREERADDADSRLRFVREAEVTGHLEHPGVVPVYGLGVYEDGKPYYAMRLIKGEPMDEAIRRFHKADEDDRRDPGERSLALRELLGRFVAVCEAVAYAHSRDVLHRDLKPANVMLGEYGETLVVDWGLARLLGRDLPEAKATGQSVKVASNAMATQMGQAVGTPAFMPPEQARGELDKMGPASDVFSLGAILYSLLTGSAPYKGQSVGELLSQAVTGEVIPAGRRKAGVPRALEAVCAKAMAASPAERYADARALAADVKQWLADEPTSAYREPLPDRLRRWGRRHRSVVSGGVMLLVAGVLGLGGGLWAVSRQKRETEIQRDRAVLAEREAKANLKLAEKAIDECYNVAYKDPLFQGPQTAKVRKLLLRKTLPYYRNFQARRPDDPQLQREEADQWLRVGNIEALLGNAAEAREAYENASKEYATLANAHPEDPEHQRALAAAHNNLGALLKDQGKPKEALGQFRQAREIQSALAKAYTKVPDYRSDLASTQNNLGLLMDHVGKPKEAPELFRQAIEIQSALAKAAPDVPEYREALARTHNSLGLVLEHLGKPKEALAQYRQARGIQSALVNDYPSVPAYAAALATTQSNVGPLLVSLGEHREALEQYNQSLEYRSALAKAHPDMPEYLSDLAASQTNLGALLTQEGEGKEAAKVLGKALAIQTALVNAYPGVAQYRAGLADIYNNLGNLQITLNDAKGAAKEYREAIRIQTALVEASPHLPGYRNALARTHYNLGVTLHTLGNPKEAQKPYREALENQLALVEAHPDVPEYQIALAGTHSNLGVLLALLGKREEALKQLGQTLAIRSALVNAFPEVEEHHFELARTHYNLASVEALEARHADGDQPKREKKANHHAKKALALLTRAKDGGFFRDPENVKLLETDEFFDFVRQRDDFRAFVAGLKSK